MEAVLIFQLGIVASMILVKRHGNRTNLDTGRRYMLYAAIAWSVETVIYVFFPPLIVLQLIVIWGSYHVLTRPKMATSKAPSEIATSSLQSATTLAVNMWVEALRNLLRILLAIIVMSVLLLAALHWIQKAWTGPQLDTAIDSRLLERH